MYLTDSDYQAICDWARERLTDPRFILNKKRYEKCVIFGADAPQRRYVQCIELADFLWLTHEDKLKNAKETQNKENLKSFFKAKCPKIFNLTKENFNRVSNYWLKPIQAIAGAATLQSGSPEAKPDAYLKSALVGTKEKDVKQFWDRFGKSPHDLNQKVIPAASRPDFTSPKAAEVTKTGNSKEAQHYVYDFAVRRACKFLLYDAIALKKPVFYALDQLNLEIVADLVGGTDAIRDEVKIGASAEEKKVPICTSEIRELFRYWDELSKNVTFFENLNEVEPPWARVDVDKWARYAVHRAKKTRAMAEKANRGGELPGVDEIESWTGKAAIDNYHRMRPYTFRNQSNINHVIVGQE